MILLIYNWFVFRVQISLRRRLRKSHGVPRPGFLESRRTSQLLFRHKVLQSAPAWHLLCFHSCQLVSLSSCPHLLSQLCKFLISSSNSAGLWNGSKTTPCEAVNKRRNQRICIQWNILYFWHIFGEIKFAEPACHLTRSRKVVLIFFRTSGLATNFPGQCSHLLTHSLLLYHSPISSAAQGPLNAAKQKAQFIWRSYLSSLSLRLRLFTMIRNFGKKKYSPACSLHQSAHFPLVYLVQFHFQVLCKNWEHRLGKFVSWIPYSISCFWSFFS